MKGNWRKGVEARRGLAVQTPKRLRELKRGTRTTEAKTIG